MFLFYNFFKIENEILEKKIISNKNELKGKKKKKNLLIYLYIKKIYHFHFLYFLKKINKYILRNNIYYIWNKLQLAKKCFYNFKTKYKKNKIEQINFKIIFNKFNN